MDDSSLVQYDYDSAGAFWRGASDAEEESPLGLCGGVVAPVEDASATLEGEAARPTGPPAPSESPCDGVEAFCAPPLCAGAGVDPLYVSPPDGDAAALLTPPAAAPDSAGVALGPADAVVGRAATTEEEESLYERLRRERVSENKRALESLGIRDLANSLRGARHAADVRGVRAAPTPRPAAPTRRSSRIRGEQASAAAAAAAAAGHAGAAAAAAAAAAQRKRRAPREHAPGTGRSVDLAEEDRILTVQRGTARLSQYRRIQLLPRAPGAPVHGGHGHGAHATAAAASDVGTPGKEVLLGQTFELPGSGLVCVTRIQTIEDPTGPYTCWYVYAIRRREGQDVIDRKQMACHLGILSALVPTASIDDVFVRQVRGILSQSWVASYTKSCFDIATAHDFQEREDAKRGLLAELERLLVSYTLGPVVTGGTSPLPPETEPFDSDDEDVVQDEYMLVNNTPHSPSLPQQIGSNLD